MASDLVAGAGTLYVVATPLGHLGDLTARAADLLRRVPVVAAEDTRRTLGLLNHLGARPTLLSFHAHSPEHRVERLLGELRAGRDVALVTDAGTPGISDPGAELVAAVRGAGMSVVPLPGAAAVTAALSASGLPADRYLFLGFLPRKGAERARLIAGAAASEWPVAFYEAPTRVQALLADLAAAAGGERHAVVARELTKVHEEFRTGTLTELAGYYEEHEPRGEFTVVLAGGAPPRDAPATDQEIAERARALLAEGRTRRDVVERLAPGAGRPRKEVYRIVMDLS